jgi:hypothetical protein
VLMYARDDFGTAMELLADGLLDGLPPEDLVQRFTLDRVADVFHGLKDGSIHALKASIAVGGAS